MNSKLPLSDFFANGKMDVDFEIHDSYIIGVCNMYPERSAGSGEYMIRERSVVELDKQRGLSACVQEAKNLAYESSVNRLLCKNIAVAAPAAQIVEQASASAKVLPLTDTAKEESRAAATPKAENDVPVPALLETPSANMPPNDSSGDGLLLEDEQAQRITLDSLVTQKPGADQANPDDSESLGGDAGMEYKKALATTITICGKAHEKYGRTAGEILNSDPELIVYLATKDYGGAKVDEYAAVKTLYHDAVGMVHRAA